MSAKGQSWGDSTLLGNMFFISVEVAPKFPGGMKGYYLFLAENLKMPDKSFSKKFNRTASLDIFIDTTGKVAYARIVDGINESYNNAIFEMIKRMPAWTPGLQNGHKVPTMMVVPLIFVN